MAPDSELKWCCHYQSSRLPELAYPALLLAQPETPLLEVAEAAVRPLASQRGIPGHTGVAAGIGAGIPVARLRCPRGFFTFLFRARRR
jgi:hypothetical protein